MKLLLVNGNTTQAVTDRVLAEARRCAAPGTEVTGATARFGVSIVSTEAENDIAAHAVLDTLSATLARMRRSSRSRSILLLPARARFFRSRSSA
jgi:Asp/Glu/hydantoin racemase